MIVHGRRTRAGSLAILAAACAALAAPIHGVAAAGDESPTERARARYAFAGWPGRSEPARDGVDPAALRIAALGPTTIEYRAASGGPAMTARAAGEAALVHVWVEDDPLAAQEELLVYLSGCALPLERLEGHAAPGDVAFGREGPDGRKIVAFARANMAVAVRGVAASVDALVRSVDAAIASSPILGKEAPKSAPRVLRLERGDPKAAEDRRALVLLETEGALARREVRVEGGAAFAEDRGDGEVLVHARAPGTYRVRVDLVGLRGFRASARIDVTVP